MRAYLLIKHHVERGASLTLRPSAVVRDKLRAEVAATFRPSPRARVRRFFARPIPLYQSLAAAALIAVASLASPLLRRIESNRHEDFRHARTEQIDTSRRIADSVAFF